MSWRLSFHRRRVKPLLFTAFNILVAFTAGSIVLLILKQKTPVARTKIRRRSGRSGLNPVNKLRGFFTKSRGGSV